MVTINANSKKAKQSLNRFDENKLLSCVVNRYVSTGKISAEKAERVEREVKAEFRSNKESFMKEYKGDADFITYCIAVFVRLVREKAFQNNTAFIASA